MFDPSDGVARILIPWIFFSVKIFLPPAAAGNRTRLKAKGSLIQGALLTKLRLAAASLVILVLGVKALFEIELPSL